MKKVVVPSAPPLFSGERDRGRKVGRLVGALFVLAVIASFLAGVLVGMDQVVSSSPPDIKVEIVLPAQAAEATSSEASPAADLAIAEPEVNCPEGTIQIPGWAPGLCGDEDFLAMASGQPQGEILGPGSGVLVILSENVEDHCYGDAATFWPLTDGVNGSIPVARDYPATVEFPEGRWGLGGATECTP